MSGAGQQYVVVTGDATFDRNLAQRKSRWPTRHDEMHSYLGWTGAYLLGELMEGVQTEFRTHRNVTIEVHALGRSRPNADSDFFQATFQRYPTLLSAGDTPQNEESAWRIAEFQGLQRGATSVAGKPRLTKDPPNATLALIDDMDLGFRKKEMRERWPVAITRTRQSLWVVLKMAHPVAEGDLWKTLISKHADRLIVVIPINELRLSRAYVSRSLSWERSAQDVAWELANNPSVNALAYCAHVIVLFGPVGAVLYTRVASAPSTPRFTLFFDPLLMEDTWEHLHPGQIYGGTHVMSAAIGRQILIWATTPDRGGSLPDLTAGVLSGLAGIRSLYRVGFGQRGATEPAKSELRFPCEQVLEAIQNASVERPDSPVCSVVAINETEPTWTILQDRQAEDPYSLALRIALHGLKTELTDIPRAEFGDLTPIDREEIESFRSIQALVSEYSRSAEQKPLCIAVFGPPGSGKSYGITQVAMSLLPGKVEKCEFNLSQFESRKDLVDALIQVGSVTLRGRMPLVFWDEFDAALGQEPYGWLRHFLAPMQDGRFQMGQVTLPIGKAIFVFAGGICRTMKEYRDKVGPRDDTDNPTVDDRAVKAQAAKLPDFLSRLRGYIDIRGINQPPGGSGSRTAQMIRRAIVLRSVLQRLVPHIFDKDELRIDEGVLRAFLSIGEYTHGVRSMESIVAMSRLIDQRRFGASSLPAEDQLAPHIDDPRNFLRLVRAAEWYENQLEDVAKRVHDEWCAAVKRTKDDLPAANEQYSKLKEDERDMNRVFVRDIGRRVKALGYGIVRAGSPLRLVALTGTQVERLAKDMHKDYVFARKAAGWIYGERFDPDKRHDSQLRDWDTTTEKRREQVRQLVRAIPQILTVADCVLVADQRLKRSASTTASYRPPH